MKIDVFPVDGDAEEALTLWDFRTASYPTLHSLSVGNLMIHG